MKFTIDLVHKLVNLYEFSIEFLRKNALRPHLSFSAFYDYFLKTIRLSMLKMVKF
jgi:hypothetical protein